MKRFLSAVVLSCVAFVAVAALIPDLKFRRLDTRDGLSNSQVNCVYRDSKGYVWAGTPYGLNRYDGYRFRTFLSYEKDTTSLRSNYIDEIYEACDGRLWLKQGMSYTIYDPVTERFDRNPTAELERMGIEGGVERLYIDSKKNFWVKTYENGFFYYNPYTKKLRHFLFGYGPHEFSKDFGVVTFYEWRNSMVLVSNFGELMCINGETGYVSWKSSYVRRHFDNYSDFGLYVDPHTNLWVMSHSKQLYIYVQKEKRWYNSLARLMRSRGLQDVPDEIIVWDVRYDTEGLLWVATDHLGLLVIDWKNRQWRQFTNQKGDETSLSDITVKHLHLDQLGRMWVASYKNGINMNAENMQNFQNIALGDVNTICEDTAGNYWLGLNDGGIRRYNPKTGEQVVFNKQNAGLTSDVMVGSHASRDGSIWFGTFEGGLLCYRNGQFSSYRASDANSKLATNNVWSVTEDRQGNIWAGVLGGGITRINRRTGEQRTFSTGNSAIKSDWTTSIQCTPKGLIAVGSSEYYALVNPGNLKLVNEAIPETENGYTIAPATNHVIIDSRGLVWQGSASGLAVYDRKTKQVTLIDMKSGLLGSSVCSVIEDLQHHIWVATDHGVSRVAAQQGDDGRWSFVVSSYNDRDGLQTGPYNQRSICLTHDGLILVGGQEGLDVINPAQLSSSKVVVKPRFSQLLVADEEIIVGEEYDGHVILKEALDECRHVTLKYGENNFTVRMASDNGECKSQQRFVYRLKGFNDRWVKTELVNPNISYTALRPGNYTLCVRMLNDDGTYGTEESQLDITIKAPYWRTRWALLLYVLAVLAIALCWRRWFIKRQNEQMELEQLRRETEKKQWMSEMQKKMMDEVQQHIRQVEEPKLSAELRKDNLVSLVSDVCRTYKAPADKRTRIVFESSESSVPVVCDASLLSQAVKILIGNSVKFSPSASVVTVSVERTEAQRAVIRVKDQGVGVPDEARAHMFEAFVTDEEGIGLNVVKDVVDAHHGDIFVEDNPQGGTVFVLSIPVDTDGQGPLKDHTVIEGAQIEEE